MGSGAGVTCGPGAPILVAMRVLGIETSCDETGVAVYDTAIGGADGLRAQAGYARSPCTPNTAAWCPNWPAATMCASCCR